MELLDYLMFGLIPIGALSIWDGINRLRSKASYEQWEKRLTYRGEGLGKWRKNLYNPFWYSANRFVTGAGNIFIGLLLWVGFLKYFDLI